MIESFSDGGLSSLVNIVELNISHNLLYSFEGLQTLT
jgi:hypothetical protein